MLPAQRNKIDISKLTPEQQTAFRLYGKLPSNAKSLAKKPAPRQYFDSGDYAMSKSGKQTDSPVGTEHPSPENIPHHSNGNLSGVPIPQPSTSPTNSVSIPSGSSPTSTLPAPAVSALSPGKASPPGLTTVGVAALPSPASAHTGPTHSPAVSGLSTPAAAVGSTPAPGLGTVPLSVATSGTGLGDAGVGLAPGTAPVDIARANASAGVGEDGESLHGTPIMSPPPPASPIKGSSLSSEVTVDDVEMEDNANPSANAVVEGDAVASAQADSLDVGMSS